MNKTNAKRLTAKEIQQAIGEGAKFVHYHYVVSFILGTTKGKSALKLLKPGESILLHGFWYSLITLLFGWWGVPSGPSTTIKTIRKNLQGGEDVTNQLLALSAGYLMYEEANKEKK